jgi:hypothetical protein
MAMLQASHECKEKIISISITLELRLPVNAFKQSLDNYLVAFSSS